MSTLAPDNNPVQLPAGAEDHLVSLGVLTLGGDGDVTEGLLVSEVLERGHHVGLEVIPTETELLVPVVSSRHLARVCFCVVRNNKRESYLETF